MRILFANNNTIYTSKEGLKLFWGGLIFLTNDKVQVSQERSGIPTFIFCILSRLMNLG